LYQAIGREGLEKQYQIEEAVVFFLKDVFGNGTARCSSMNS